MKNESLQAHDVVLSLATQRQHSALRVALSRENKTAGTLDVVLDAGLEKLADVNALAAATFKVDANIGPLSLPQTLEMANGRTKSWLTQGLMRLTVAGNGTLAAPELKVRGSVEAPGAGKVSLGKWNAAWDYAAKTHDVSVVMFSPQGGSLQVKGQAELDVGLNAVQKGMDAMRTPNLDLKIDNAPLRFRRRLQQMIEAEQGAAPRAAAE